MKSCIFCANPRTNKRGEHVWDDWLNRQGGKVVIDPSTTSYYGAGGEFVRSHPSIGMHVAMPVVCDPCNNDWMSEVSNLAKDRLEPIIRRGTPTDFNEYDLWVITAFAFLKSAVLDWSSIAKGREPKISRESCVTFRRGLVTSEPPALNLPNGLQVWTARYQRFYAMEAFAFIEEMIGSRGTKGYRILVITYVVGSFIFQLTCPRWIKAARNRPPSPFFEVPGDKFSDPIWPGVSRSYWPPLLPVDKSALEAFRERFRKARFHAGYGPALRQR